MDRDAFLKQVKSLLAEAFGPRLRGVVLYGSEARGDAGPDSDIDLLVLLDGPVDHQRDSRICIHALYELVLSLERPIHAKPVDADRYWRSETPLFAEARREGVPA